MRCQFGIELDKANVPSREDEEGVHWLKSMQCRLAKRTKLEEKSLLAVGVRYSFDKGAALLGVRRAVWRPALSRKRPFP